VISANRAAIRLERFCPRRIAANKPLLRNWTGSSQPELLDISGVGRHHLRNSSGGHPISRDKWSMADRYGTMKSTIRAKSVLAGSERSVARTSGAYSGDAAICSMTLWGKFARRNVEAAALASVSSGIVLMKRPH
jgi:hypothetical protein